MNSRSMARRKGRDERNANPLFRWKTSAITSNIEEAAAVFPENQSRTVVESFDMSTTKGDERKDTLPSKKKSAENLDAPLKKYLDSAHQTKCFETCTFGCKACFHWANMNTACIARKSIHNVIGEHVFKFSLKESDPNVPIEKLRLTIQGGAHVADQMVHLFKNEEKYKSIEELNKIYQDDTDESSETSSSNESGLKKIIALKQVTTSQQQDNDQEQQEPNQKKPQFQQHHPLDKKQKLDDTSSSSSSSSSDSSDRTQNDTYTYGRQQQEKSYPSGEKDGDKKKHGKKSHHNDEKELQGRDLVKVPFRESRIEDSSSPLSHSDASSRNESSWEEEAKTPGGVLLPNITVVFEAVRRDSKVQGYSFSLYEKHDHFKTHFKIVAGQLNHTKWRACLDSLMLPSKFQYSLSWGHECKDYKIQLKMSTGKVAIYKAVELKMKWTKLHFLQDGHYFRFMYLLPGIAYHLGFSTVYQKNPAHEFTVRIIEKSPAAHVAIIKIPRITFYKDDFYPEFFPTAIPTPHYQNPKLSKLNVALWLSKEVEAVCEVKNERITTFDNKTFSMGIVDTECDHLIVKDCTTSDRYISKFQIWIHNKPGLPNEIHIFINSAEITIRGAIGMLEVLHNKAPIPTNRDRYEDTREKIEILRTTNHVIINTSEYGLESVTYDGDILRIKTSAKVQGKTCGLCGDYNGEMKDENLIPHQAGTEQYSDF